MLLHASYEWNGRGLVSCTEILARGPSNLQCAVEGRFLAWHKQPGSYRSPCHVEAESFSENDKFGWLRGLDLNQRPPAPSPAAFAGLAIKKTARVYGLLRVDSAKKRASDLKSEARESKEEIGCGGWI